MTTHRSILPLVAAILSAVFTACQSTSDHHHHTATPHHGKIAPSDCTATSECRG